ncbi:MAG TPA: hypothetical protein VM509_10345 [Planctomycetota bacterium]|nr:hypothetical protein [Planctomycetota bacterium]
MHSSPSLRRAFICLALILSTSAVGLAWISRAPAPAGEALKTAMHQIDESLKALGKGVTAENRPAMLVELAKLETAVMTAKAETPESAAKVDEKKRDAFVAEYRKTLVETLQFALSTEVAILDAKYKEADTLIRNKLGGMKSKGHGKFKTDGGY